MSNTEKETAEKFSKTMNSIGFQFDFSIDSLNDQVDCILNSNKVSFDNVLHNSSQNHAGLEAYIGETLVRLYNGQWVGSFNAENPASNFYLSFIKFGNYEFYPSRFLGYRISNGENLEGTFNQYLQKIIPKCINRS